MLYMQIGRTDDAQKLLDAAFRADPFHVRVSNMRKVLKVLKGYKVVTTDHFVIHYDSKADDILARYMAEYLEEQYGPLTKYFGFEPPQRTQFEIYHNGRGLSAHKWFSARMVGLPWIQTIGASTGMIVALASPTAGNDEYNWARVLKHEFVHIITLQQTKFNIPHWFTEALAVSAEGFARPAVWNTLLQQRVPKGEIRSLDTLSQAFIRPESPMDWQFAYCQSRLYAQYMTEKFGPETISKMLHAYRQGTSTRNAIKQVFGMDQELFEKGYREFLNSIVADLGDDQSVESKTFAQLEKDYKNDKQNLNAAAAYADGLMQLKRRTQARELALSVLEKDPKNPIAAIVMADLALIARSRETAAEYLIAALDRSKPHRRVLLFLAYVRSRQGDNLKAAELYGLASKHFPHNVNAVRGLAVAYLREENYKAARPVLIMLAHMDADSASVRRRLAELALDRNDYAEAIKYGQAALYVDVMDARTHRMLGDAHTGLKEHAKALREFEVALQITPRDTQIELKLVKSLRANGKTDEAKTRLQQLVEKNPEFRAAKELLESLR
jgi:tetratricopeptide (TPR) repeat protein